MKYIAALLIAVFCVIAPVSFTGCKSTPTTQAVVFNTFKSTWTERVVAGKVTPEAEAKADAAWNKSRATFKTAFNLASTDWSSPTPATLDAAQKELIAVLTQLSQ